MAEVIVAMGTVCIDASPLTATSIVEQALQQASGTKIPIKCFGCSNLPKYDDKAYHLWRDCPHKADQEVWRNFQVNLQKFRDERQNRNAQRGGGPGQNSQYGNGSRNQYGPARTMLNWERQGYPSQQVHDQIQAIADENNSVETRMTLLTTLTQSLNGYQREEAEQEETRLPPNKKAKWKKGNPATYGRSFLMYMKPKPTTTPKSIPRTMLGSPPKKKYPFKIAYKLPFITFPIGDGRTSEDAATLTGLLDTGGCCNMGWLVYHKAIADQFPQLVDEFVELESEQYETINIGGLKEGVTLTHMIRYAIPFTDKGEQCYVTLGLTDDLPIDTLYGLGFQQDVKMKIDFASKRVESALLQATFPMTFKEPRRTNPEHVRSEERSTPKSLLTIDE
jgi:hypothetical protein